MLSIIICTRNRADLLPYCLDSFVRQTAASDLFEVIVVDNRSSDTTKAVVESFYRKTINVRYVWEDNVGLSSARNRGCQEATFPWVSYVDDDAKAYPDYVERVLWVIEKFQFDCFGGRFFPWYLEQKPRWLPPDFGLFPQWLAEVGELPANRTVAGGVMVFKKPVLEEVGGFPVNLGMVGEKVGYGEENWVQHELRKRSYRIGFDPELKIDHLVASYKFNVSWHMKRYYAKGRDGRLLGEMKHPNAILFVSKTLAYTTKEFFKNGFRFIKKHDYYWENFVVDTFGFFFIMIGYFRKK